MNSDLSEILRRERLKRGYSLRVAAGKIGISHTYLASLENGTDPRTGMPLMPTQAVISKICRAYQLDVNEAAALLDFDREDDLYIYMARRLYALKEKDPAKYREMLNIVMGNRKL